MNSQEGENVSLVACVSLQTVYQNILELLCLGKMGCSYFS